MAAITCRHATNQRAPHPSRGDLLTSFRQPPGAEQASSVIVRLANPKPAKQLEARDTMSQNGGDASKASSPGRPRHQIRRSISEISSPVRLQRHNSHRAVREIARDHRASAPQSAIQARRSFEWSARSEGVTPNLTPSASRRTSVLYASADEAMPATKASKDNGSLNGLTKEQQKAVARER